jgi:hypothetical protein
MSATVSRRLLVAGIPVFVASAAAARLFSSPPKDLDLSRRKPTADALYLAAIDPASGTPKVGPMHAWMLTLETADGRPVPEARVTVGGGMPQHGHGLPTRPAVTRMLGDGRYLVEGVRFNMGGWWEFRFDIEGPQGADSVTFNLVL